MNDQASARRVSSGNDLLVTGRGRKRRRPQKFLSNWTMAVDRIDTHTPLLVGS